MDDFVTISFTETELETLDMLVKSHYSYNVGDSTSARNRLTRQVTRKIAQALIILWDREEGKKTSDTVQ